MKKDYSKEIYETYFRAKDKILKITLHNGEVLEGIFISFVHGDRNFDESYIIKWRFISESEIEKHKNLPRDFEEDYGREIEQADIKNVTFKE